MKTIENADGTHTTTYYNPDEMDANHAVALIGYDDDYPAEDFKIVPPGNGAWLIKNSWGTESGYTGSDGSTWVSYYDRGINTMAAFETAPASAYDNNYQYDGGVCTHQDVICGSTGYMANVFTATGDEVLKAVSFFNTGNINVAYEVQIYLNPEDASDSTSGTPVLRTPQTGMQIYAGYHTVTLDQTVDLKKGDVFAVVMKLDAAEALSIAVDRSVTLTEAGKTNGVWGISTTKASTGQSFMSDDGSSWKDISSDGTSNLRIKAFTTNEERGSDTNMYIAAAAVASLAVGILALVVLVRKHRGQ